MDQYACEYTEGWGFLGWRLTPPHLSHCSRHLVGSMGKAGDRNAPTPATVRDFVSVLGWEGRAGAVGGGRGSETQPAARGAQQAGTARPHPRQGQRFLGMTLNHPLFPHVPLPTSPEKRKNQALFSGSKRPTFSGSKHPNVDCWGLSQPLATHSEPALCLCFPLGMTAQPGSMLRSSPRERPPPLRGLGSQHLGPPTTPGGGGEAARLSPPPGPGWKQ